MSRLTKTIHGFAKKDETPADLMDIAFDKGVDEVLFEKQIDVDEGTEIKRMTIQILIKDFESGKPRAKRKTKKKAVKSMSKMVSSTSEPVTTASVGDINDNAN